MTNFATVQEVYEVTTLDRMRSLSKHHIWSDQFVGMRFNYRKEKPLSLVTLRIYRLPQPRPLAIISKYRGCLSWINLEEPVPTDGSKPVLDDSQFSRVSEEIRESLV